MRRADLNAMSFYCPECESKPGQHCTYVWPRRLAQLDPREIKTAPMILTRDNIARLMGWSPETARRMVMAGMPMIHCHNGRLQTAWLTHKKQQRSKEYARLRDWLREYGGIFEVGQPTPS